VCLAAAVVNTCIKLTRSFCFQHTKSLEFLPACRRRPRRQRSGGRVSSMHWHAGGQKHCSQLSRYPLITSRLCGYRPKKSGNKHKQHMMDNAAAGMVLMDITREQGGALLRAQLGGLGTHLRLTLNPPSPAPPPHSRASCCSTKCAAHTQRQTSRPPSHQSVSRTLPRPPSASLGSI
jgi:hypothetical protein